MAFGGFSGYATVQVSLPRRLAQRIPMARRVVHLMRGARAHSLAILALALLAIPDQAAVI